MEILFITPVVPFPPHAGGNHSRNYHFLRYLAQQGHCVDVVSFIGPGTADEHVGAVRRMCRRLVTVPMETRVAGQPAHGAPPLTPLAWQYLGGGVSPVLQEAVDHAVATCEYDVVHISTLRMAPYAHRLLGGPVLMDHMDSHTLYNLRYGVTNRLAHGNLRELRGLVDLWRYERWLGARAALSTYVTERDARILGQRAAARTRVVPVGVSFPEPLPGASMTPGAKPRDVVFVGNIGYPPNHDAVLRLLRDIMPRVRARLPEATCSVVGSGPPDDVLAYRGPQVEVTGFVEDVRDYLLSSKVIVCPMRQGAGIKTKLIEAMALGVAVVGSREAVTGLGGTPGQHYLVGDTVGAAARHTADLLESPGRRLSLVTRARELYEARFRWATICGQLDESYRAITADHMSPTAVC